MTKLNEKPLHVCECTECRQHPKGHVAKLHIGINRVAVAMDEKNRRRFVGLLALQLGRGGIRQMARITGMSRTTIVRGRRELERPSRSRSKRIRARGGGRPRVEKKDLRSGKH